MPPRRPRFTRRRLILGIGLALLLVVGAAASFVVTREPGDVNNPDVEFRSEPPPPTPTTPPPTAKNNPADSFVWPIYGYSPPRRKFRTAPATMRPPFRRVWKFSPRTLLE